MNTYFGAGKLTVVLSIAVLFFVPGYLPAQTRKIEEVKQAIQNTSDGKTKSDLYSRLAELLYSHDFEQGLVNAKEALRLALDTDYKRGQAAALTTIGTYHFYNGDNGQSLKFYQEALAVVRDENLDDFPAKTLIRLSILYRQQSAFDSSQFFLDKTAAILKEKPQGFLQASLLASEGLLLSEMSRNHEAVGILRASLSIRLELNDSTTMAHSWVNMGVAFAGLSQYDSAEYCFTKAQAIVERINDPELKMILSLRRGETAYSLGDFDKASEAYTVALSEVKKNTYKRYYSKILYMIGELYENQGAYQTAAEYLFNALKEFEKINARKDMARTLTQIGWCYVYQDNFPQALENAHKSLAITEQINDSSGIAQNQNLIGFTLYKTKKYPEALTALEHSMTIRKKLGGLWGVSYSLYNTSLVYFSIGERKKGFGLLLQALEINERVGMKSGLVFTCNELGFQYTKERDFAKASFYLAKANKMAKAIPSLPQLLANYKHFIFLHKEQGNREQVIRYYELYTALKDSLSDGNNSSRISKADALFQLQKKAVEIELVNKQNELNKEKITTQQTEISFQRTIITLVTVCLFGLTVLALIIYRLFKNNQEAKEILRNQNIEITEQKEEIQAQSEELIESNQKLYALNGELTEKNHEIEAQADRIKEVNAALEAVNDQLEKRVEDRTSRLNRAYKELETFFYRTSHDFRRPLTTYLGLVEVAKATIKDELAINLFEKVKDTTLGLDAMLHKLQSISNGAAAAGVAAINLPHIVDECCQKYADAIAHKGIAVSTKISVASITTNESLLRSALENLIENAVHFSTPDRPFLKIVADVTDDFVTITVEDNGQGIAKELHPKIFTMYYRANGNSKGNGLGLYVAHRALEKIGGSISFTSIQFKGSSFEIRMPVRFE